MNITEEKILKNKQYDGLRAGTSVSLLTSWYTHTNVICDTKYWSGTRFGLYGPGHYFEYTHTFVWTVNLTLSFSLRASLMSISNELSVLRSTDVPVAALFYNTSHKIYVMCDTCISCISICSFGESTLMLEI